MFGNNKVSVEYTLMTAAPNVWRADFDLGAKVVERVVRALYPYMVDTKDVRRIIQEGLADDVKSVIGHYQRHRDVILVQENGRSQEIKTVGLLANLYDRISVLEKENEELRFMLHQPDTKAKTL